MLYARVALGVLLCQTASALHRKEEKEAMSWHAVKSTVLFIGSGRSGSSLVGALLDAHPRVIISNEFNLVPAVLHGQMDCSQDAMWRPLADKSMKQAKKGRSGGGSYAYAMAGMWQGAAEHGEPYIVGDKKASSTTQMKFEDLRTGLKRIASCTGRPLKIIYVSRNPFDVIGTQWVRHTMRCGYLRSGCNPAVHGFYEAFDAGTAGPLRTERSKLREIIDQQFENLETVRRLSMELNGSSIPPAEVITFSYSNLIANPRQSLQLLCRQLDIACSDEYIDACTKHIHKSEHYTRLYVDWKQEDVCYTMGKALGNPLTAHFVTEGELSHERDQKPRCGSTCFPGGWPCSCATPGGRLDTCKFEG